MKKKVHSIIDKYAERGLRSLAVARQVYYSQSIMNFANILMLNFFRKHKSSNKQSLLSSTNDQMGQ